MPVKSSQITLTDQFCGAGGSSQGARNAGKKIKGIEVSLALNHWPLAIETHNTNFPDTAHDCTDVSACDPRRYPSTTGLLTSPECKTHTPAGGNNHKKAKVQIELFKSGKIDPATERSRATMWDVCRFAEYHEYEFVVTENVIEAKTQWPLFDIWLSAMHKLGYNHQCLYFNSMFFHPTPQSRDRMYVVFWKKGNRKPELNYYPPAWCQHCEKNVPSVQSWKKAAVHYGKYGAKRGQYIYCCPACAKAVEPYYYAAFNAIDWSNPGTKISERKKPLKPKTIRRIKYGRENFNEPFIIELNRTGSARSVHSHISTLLAQGNHHGLVINDQHSTGVDFRVKSLSENFQGLTTEPHFKLVHPPYIINLEHTGNNNVKPVHEAFHTQTTTDGTGLFIPPLIVNNKGQSNSTPVTDPLNTLTTKSYHGLFTDEAVKSFLAYNYKGHQTSEIYEPTDGINCKERLSLISYSDADIEDCYYRMITPKEAKLAMAFDRDYVVLGSGKNQMKQLGNAVTPPPMEFIVSQCVKSLER